MESEDEGKEVATGDFTVTDYNGLYTGYINTNMTLPIYNYAGAVAAAAIPNNMAYNQTTFAPYGNAYSNGGVDISGGARINGSLIVNGVNISDTLKTIEDRLSILVPDPKKLAKYEALRKAYAHYKLMEALCSGEDEEHGPESA